MSGPVDDVTRVSRTPRPVGIIAMLAAVVSFALSTPIVKWAGETGVVVAFWRMWFSLGLWWIVMRAMRRPFPDARTWKLVAPAGLFFGMNISLLFTAVTRTSIAHLEFITSMTPLVAVPASALIFKERPNWSALRFGVISIVGVALVLFFGPDSGTSSLEGDLIVLSVVFVWTCYLMFTKRARANGVDTITFMACMVPTGLLTTIPMALVLAGDEIFSMAARGWFVAAGLAVLTGMVAHGCIAFAQQHLPIQTITVMQTAQPALAVLFAFFLLSEQVRWPQVIGMGLVIVGISLFTLTIQRRTNVVSGQVV
ncbi:MAG: DMT family transporter [Ilumatobacter sp.]|uniref:DMT family transporter n=1 Tax=Ilumatobacter sp. TaxID=1967498 RepID=UPI00391BE388